ncbi:phosphoribosylformylglycinamidine synthase subunit PurS [bacterium]|nr:phosphoribosylformylglycinamidine synthase subunit PurS [bacterium]
MIARVVIMPKRGVLDPQGKAICSSLHAMGYGEVDDVRMGKFLELRFGDGAGGEERAARVKAMCERLLANGVIEDFRFELVEDGAPAGGRTDTPR